MKPASLLEGKQCELRTCLNPPPSLRPFPYTPLPDNTHSHSPFPLTGTPIIPCLPVPELERLLPPPSPLPPPSVMRISPTPPPLHSADAIAVVRLLLLVLLFSLPSDPFSKVGIATQLPSGTHLQDNLDYNSYWNFLLNQHDAYESLPAARLGGISYVQRVFPRL